MVSWCLCYLAWFMREQTPNNIAGRGTCNHVAENCGCCVNKIGGRLFCPALAWTIEMTLCALIFFLFIDPTYPYFLGMNLSDTSRPINWTRWNTIPADLNKSK